MSYFIIGSGLTAKDYSSHITSEKDYSVEEQPVTYKWVDGFGGSHTSTYNTKIKGKFDLFFASDSGSDFTTFLSDMATATSDDALTCTLFISNKNIAKEVKVSYTINTKKHADLIGGKKGFVVTVNVEEEAVYE